METVVFTIGAAIAKAILKFWLKDAGIAKDVSLSLVDVLDTKVSDIRAKRRAKRQFEAIGDQVAESLLPLFERAGLTDNGKEAVGLAVEYPLLHYLKVTPGAQVNVPLTYL